MDWTTAECLIQQLTRIADALEVLVAEAQKNAEVTAQKNVEAPADVTQSANALSPDVIV